jgi:signal transduction histidine kinase
MRKHTITTLAVFFLWLLLLTAQAQTPPPLERQAEVGMPLLRHYPPQEYSGGPSVWSIVQDRRGVLFFGVGNAVLEYDGVTWRKIRVPGNGRSLALDAAGKIWVGTVTNFGWLEPDAHGTLQYVSLVEKIPAEQRRFNDVWQVLPTAQGIFFRSSARLFRWDGQRMQVWATKTSFNALAAVRGRIYTSQTGSGLQEVVGDTLRDLPGGGAWKDARGMFLHPYDEQRILISAAREMLRLYDGAQALPFPTAVDEYLKKNDVYSSVPLPDGGFCLTTTKGGVVILERDGRLRRIIDQDAGLPSQSVQTAFADREGALWLGLGVGIARVDINSPISLFARVGTQDVVRYGGMLYATSNNTGTALYYLETNPLTGLSTLQPLSSSAAQAFALLSFQYPAGKAPPQLLAGTFPLGVMKIERGTVTPALPREEGPAQGARSLLQSRITPKRVFAGRQASMSSLRWENGQWIDEGRIPTNSQVLTLVEEADGTLWASDTTDGVLRVTVPATGMHDAQVERFTEKDGLGPGAHRLFLADGQVFAIPSPTKDMLRWEPATRRFVTDNRFLLPVNDSEAVARLWLLPNGDIWSQNGGFVERRQGLFRRQPDGTYQLDEEPFRGLSRLDFRNVMAESDGKLWIAGNEGLIRFDQRIKPAAPPPFAALVRRVSTGKGDVVFGGFTPDGAAPLRLPYANNSLRFAFAAPTYGDEAGTTYRYTLEGADRDWSGWDKQTEANYSSLGPGAYRLRVQARTSAGRVGEEGAYSFTILPPWYRSWWAYGVYALLLAGLLYAASRLLRRRIVAREREKSALREAELRADAAAEKAKSLQAENEAYQRLKATQEQLLVQEKLASLGALTAGIAHEIKNPLNFVNNFADLSVELMDELREEVDKLESGTPPDVENMKALLDDLTGNAKKINEHGKRADGIVRSMLLHSRGQTGERQPTDINKMLEEYVNLTYHGMRAQDSSFNVTIEREYASDAGMIDAIPQDLSRVFLNLLNNACYAVNERAKKNGAGFVPTLRVRSVNLGDAVEIRIRDNGLGIPPDVREKIFNPFFTTKPTGQGTGLGLSISHDIVVQQHGGQLEVETEPGEFTEFTVRLPRKKL